MNILPKKELFILICMLFVMAAAICFSDLTRRCQITSCVSVFATSEVRASHALDWARTFNREGSYNEAEYAYKKVLDFDQENVAALNELGDLLRHRGRYEESEKLFLKAILP